jgi:DNA-binding NarL/FixJ family response regulator
VEQTIVTLSADSHVPGRTPERLAPSARIKIEFGLTRRQQQIVPLIAQGLTNKEIASHLTLSEQTVKNHIHGIMRRVGAIDRLQVIDLTHFSGGIQ